MTKGIRFRNMEKTILHQAFKIVSCNKVTIYFKLLFFILLSTTKRLN